RHLLMGRFRHDLLHVELRRRLEPAAEEIRRPKLVVESALHNPDPFFVVLERYVAVGWRGGVEGQAKGADGLHQLPKERVTAHARTSRSPAALIRRRENAGSPKRKRGCGPRRNPRNDGAEGLEPPTRKTARPYPE